MPFQPPPPPPHAPQVVLGLTAVIVAVTEEAPFVLVTRASTGATSLPSGPFDPAGDRTLELALRGWVSEQTGFDIGYVEQLYTFADRGREAPLEDIGSLDGGRRVISIGYLALTQSRATLRRAGALWRSWYDYFPWEDWRNGKPRVIDEAIAPRLRAWANERPAAALQRMTRCQSAFALDGVPWNEERALDRYELLYEAGLAPEAARDRARFEGRPIGEAPIVHGALGEPMAVDHRRILATALGRVRAKMKYRPIIFELAPDRFTLLHLQRLVESIAGLELHKQNFRRLLDRTGLVEGTGVFDSSSGGRPAELFQFRREGIPANSFGGVHVPSPRRD